MGLSLPHILIFAVVAILLLGGGRFSSMMGDVAKGVKQFKKGMAEDDDEPAPAKPAARLQAQPPLDPQAGDATLQPMKDDRPNA
ncbi:twin-arginine translocase TatA/TatE family subunit [Sphingomonas jatrophae]|uniref:Sec-independent protein translocase protein TatA n=1 Tax=Sphingomonas jatrophae TaxID=1166337 RepID=A0A1I6JGH7_9SPHN|nr:twin-arginine translocase TatA/TatE family subunit [Sphingomonas jatrophae]SFR77979.1 sec-independent protein translocase protein TatA [Sphingomonas jatrophae]